MLRTPTSENFEPTTLRGYLSILARRKWLFVFVLVLVPLVAVLVSLQSQSRYEAKSQVLLIDQDFAGSLIGTQSALTLNPDRVLSTQASVARTPVLVRRVIKAAGVGNRTTTDFLNNSDVTPLSGTNVLEFSVVDPFGPVAQRLATDYARQFIGYSRELQTNAIERARAGIVAEMARLASQGGRDSPLYARLKAEAQTLQTSAALQTSNAQLLREADRADKVAPRPARTGMFALVAALLLAIGLIAVLEALDTRVRTDTEIADTLGLPLLGRIAEESAGRRRVGVAVLEEPDSAAAESYRILRANIEYANTELGSQIIMLTSSVRDEGKSTTVANLAASFARMGRHVVLVDLDLRRPSAHRRFSLPSSAVGLSDVVGGRVGLEAALVRVPIEARNRGADGARRIARWMGGTSAPRPVESVDAASAVLEVLPAGALPSDVGEFVGTKGVTEILESLRKRADIIFVDAPPVLEVSDPRTLMRHIDALVVVARLGVVRHQMLRELNRVLDASSAPTLGLVITGVEAVDDYTRQYERRDSGRLLEFERAEESSVSAAQRR